MLNCEKQTGDWSGVQVKCGKSYTDLQNSHRNPYVPKPAEYDLDEYTTLPHTVEKKGCMCQCDGGGLYGVLTGQHANLIQKKNTKGFSAIEYFGNHYNQNDDSAGQAGGECKCPDGQTYKVGSNNGCLSLACIGGEMVNNSCKTIEGDWSNKSVICGQKIHHSDKVFYQPSIPHQTCDKAIEYNQCMSSIVLEDELNESCGIRVALNQITYHYCKENRFCDLRIRKCVAKMPPAIKGSDFETNAEALDYAYYQVAKRNCEKNIRGYAENPEAIGITGGGYCMCPDGSYNKVGKMQGSDELACSHGQTAKKFNYGEFIFSNDKVIENADGVGAWGGTCSCGNGVKYMVGDIISTRKNHNECGDLACEGVGAKAGPCKLNTGNKPYEGKWSHRKVVCGRNGFEIAKKENFIGRKMICNRTEIGRCDKGACLGGILRLPLHNELQKNYKTHVKCGKLNNRTVKKAKDRIELSLHIAKQDQIQEHFARNFIKKENEKQRIYSLATHHIERL